jgi:ProQ/FINO family
LGPHPKRRILTLPVKAPWTTAAQMALKSPPTPLPPRAAPMEPEVAKGPPARPSDATAGPSDAGAARIAASRARRIARNAAMAWLAATYPAAFGLNGNVKPVAIGAGKLIWPAAKAAGIKRRALNDALSRRAGSPAYLEALVEDGAMRIDLDGAVVKPVSIEHQVNALDRLAKIKHRLDGAR